MGLSGLLPAGMREPARSFRLSARIARLSLIDRLTGIAGRFAEGSQTEIVAGAEPAAAGYPVMISEFSAPIINPAFQAHVYGNKMHNLGLVRDRLHGLIVPPGGIVSFWHRVGPPDEAHGFREASAFINLEVTFAMGGGLCQLSGVLFNAALQAGCAILERHAHSIDAYGDGRYIPLGRDATVVWGWKDLRFANPFDRDLLLTVELVPDRATVRVHAPQPVFRAVTIEVEESDVMPPVEKITPDAGLPAGESAVGHPGFTGRTTRTFRTVTGLDGTERRERIATDTYRMMPKIVKIGAGS